LIFILPAKAEELKAIEKYFIGQIALTLEN
jgi:hypothetical protein